MNFLSIFILVMAIFLWGFVHSLMASLQFKALIRRAFGLGIDRYYRLFYNLFSLVTFALVVQLALMIPDRTLYVVPFPWVILMFVGELLALAGLLIAFRQTDALDFIGLRQIIDRHEKKPQKLVTNGMYAYVRHPLYTTGLLIIWLLPFMTARLLVVNIALTVYIVVGAYFEERKLRNRFGQEYVEYVAETPMFIPFLKRLRNRMTL